MICLLLISGTFKFCEWISKRVFQENKARQIFRKTSIYFSSNPDTRTYLCLSGGKIVRFSENLTCFVFLKHPFEIRPPFCLITEEIVDTIRKWSMRRQAK